MVNPVEVAHEHIHEATHGGHDAHEANGHWPRNMAVVVSFLAASLALAGIGAKSSQTAYLTHHIAASDLWNFFQAKNLRANLRNSQAILLESMPNADTPAMQERIKAAHAEENRMRDDPAKGEGTKQLAVKAEHEEHERDHALHLYHNYEYASGAMEISIVLASVSVVTKIRPLGVAAGLIGLAACAYGLATYLHFV